MGFVDEALERFGLVGARALGYAGLGQSWYGRRRHRALGPGKVQEDKKPEECEQDERRENMMRHHGVVPLQHVVRWGILPGFGGGGILRRVAVHDPINSAQAVPILQCSKACVTPERGLTPARTPSSMHFVPSHPVLTSSACFTILSKLHSHMPRVERLENPSLVKET